MPLLLPVINDIIVAYQKQLQTGSIKVSNILRLVASAALASTIAFSIGAASAADCKHSKWGKDDEIGAANYVTPQQVFHHDIHNCKSSNPDNSGVMT